MELSPELVIADRFRLARLLGEGGMGSVWLAHHIRLQIPCAVKFMRPQVAAQPTFRARFDREAVAAAKLRSPHVVQILDHGVWEETPYIAMEYLEGEDLEQRLRRQTKLSPAETVAIVTQIARALTKAHAAGLVHRDLKPPNIFLVHDDDREIVKVLDFGVAKSTEPLLSGETKTGSLVGTPFYMSPEQARGVKSVDHRTDLWALGVVVFQCLTGALPFMSDSFGDLAVKIIVDPLPVPSELAPVPPGFDAWWARAVARDPAARFQSAKELADALAVALDVRGGEGVVGALSPSRDTNPQPAADSSLVTPPAGAQSALSLSTPPVVARSRAPTFVMGAIALALLLGGAAFALHGRGVPVPVESHLEAAPLPPKGATTAVLALPAPEVTPLPDSGLIVQPSAPAPSAALSASAALVPGALPKPVAGPMPKSSGRPATPAPPATRDIGF